MSRVPQVVNNDRRSRQEVHLITLDDEVDEESLEVSDFDEGVQDEREIWDLTHVSEEELESTEGQGLDLLAELLDLTGWSQVNDKDTEKALS